MKRIVCIFTIVLMIFTLGSCGGGSYAALGMVKSNVGNSASLGFASFRGYYTFVLTPKGDEDRTLHYRASVEDGELSAIYETPDGEWEPLFTVKSGESVDSSLELSFGGRVRVKVESEGTSKSGKVSLSLK